MNRVQKYLKPFYIGDVITDEDHVEDDEALKNDFKKLKEKAISKVSWILMLIFSIDLAFYLESVPTKSFIFLPLMFPYLSI